MSGFDPLAALGASAVAQAQAAMAEAALSLDLGAELLQQKVAVGDVLTATIMTPENGVDRIELFGQPVAAQLPPGIHPGETLSLVVTAIRGTQIVVRNLGNAPASEPPGASQAPPRPAMPVSARTTPPVVPDARPRELFIEAERRPIDAARPEETPPPPVRQIRIEPEEAPFQARIAFSRLAPQAENAPPARLSVPPPVIARDAGTPAVQPAPPRPDGPVGLLARLRVPVTAITLAAARVVSDAADRLPRAYARLDALLARVPPGDARVATLRAVLGFAGRIDPSNARALPEQIASFVSNVVAGPESKLAQIARALAPKNDALAPDGQAPQTAPAAQARAVERIAALDHDVKTALLALVQSPPHGAPPELAQALGDALTATTAVQLNVLSSHQNDPNAIAIPLPATFYDGGRPTQLRISRDARDANGALDADNFHIAFVLDTQTLGTVAIDLKTVGRAVSVSVKTERASAADRFRETFHHLRDRFEQLRYRIAAIDAAVAPRAAAQPPAPAQAQAPVPDRRSNLDMRA